MSILDQLAIRVGSMANQNLWTTSTSISTQVSIPIPGRTKGLSLPVPFYFSQQIAGAAHSDWPELCALFRRIGIPVVGTIHDFEKLPAAAIPARIGRRYAADRLDLNEISTADVFEIVCRPAMNHSSSNANAVLSAGSSMVPMLPLEIDEPNRLATLIRLLKDLSGGDIPIGAAVCLSVPAEDLAVLLASDLDFLTLEATAMQGVPDMEWHNWIAIHVGRIRAYCRSIGRPEFPLLVEHPFSTMDWIVKLLALGATIVSMDGLVNSAVAEMRRVQPDTLARGMLAGIGDPYSKPSKSIVATVEESLGKLMDRLRTMMRIASCESLTHFDVHCLITYDEQVSKLTGANVVEFKGPAGKPVG